MKILFLMIFSILAFSAELNYKYSLRIEAKPEPYYDFGVQGKEYNITEPDMYEIIMSSVENFKKSEEMLNLRKEFIKKVKEKSIFNYSNNFCSKNRSSEWKDDYYTYKQDMRNPFGRIIQKKGDRLLTPAIPGEKDLCFVDGSNDIVLKNQISFFKKQTKNNCLFVIQNKSVIDIWKKFPNIDIYPGSKALYDRFGVKCIPSIVKMSGSKMKVNQYSIEYFKRGD